MGIISVPSDLIVSLEFEVMEHFILRQGIRSLISNARISPDQALAQPIIGAGNPVYGNHFMSNRAAKNIKYNGFWNIAGLADFAKVWQTKGASLQGAPLTL